MPLSDSASSSSVYQNYWPAAVAAGVDIVASLGAHSRAIRVGHGGTLVVVRRDGTSITITGIAYGETLPIQAISITQAGSTAYDLLVMT